MNLLRALSFSLAVVSTAAVADPVNVVTTHPGATSVFGLGQASLVVREGAGSWDDWNPYGFSTFVLQSNRQYYSNDPDVVYASAMHGFYAATAPVVSTFANGFKVTPSAYNSFSGGIPLGTGDPGANNTSCCYREFSLLLNNFEITPDAGWLIDHYQVTVDAYARGEGGNASLVSALSTTSDQSLWHESPFEHDGSLQFSDRFDSVEGLTFWFQAGAPAYKYPGGQWSFRIDSLSVEAVLRPVPEPATFALSLLAGLVLALRLRRQT